MEVERYGERIQGSAWEPILVLSQQPSMGTQLLQDPAVDFCRFGDCHGHLPRNSQSLGTASCISIAHLQLRACNELDYVGVVYAIQVAPSLAGMERDSSGICPYGRGALVF